MMRVRHFERNVQAHGNSKPRVRRLYKKIGGANDVALRPSRDEVTPQTSLIDHQEKMARKVKARSRAYALSTAGKTPHVYQGNWTELGHRQGARKKLGLEGDLLVAANVGQRHPDYGMTPLEHSVNRAARAAEAAKQIRVQMGRGAR